ncbi:MAG: RHS repeat domain-containing protein [Bacteroidota bacterium]
MVNSVSAQDGDGLWIDEDPFRSEPGTGGSDPFEFGTLGVNPPVAPDVANLSKYGNVPVNLFTGIPDIRIPIYTAVDGSISSNIGLSYHAGGIKVEEMASRVGLGWSLQAGGRITRVKRGLADDNGNGIMRTEPHRKPGVYLQAPSNDQVDLAREVLENQLDLEPDVFQFQAGQYSGTFFYDWESDSIKISPYQEISVTPLWISNRIRGWEIVTPEGMKYTFGVNPDLEYSTRPDCDFVNCRIYDVDTHLYTYGSNIVSLDDEDYISNWHLTQIKDFNNLDSISFYYSRTSSNIFSLSTERRAFPRQGESCSSITPYVNLGLNRTEIESSVLDYILTKNDSIVFVKGDIRLDFPSDSVLQAIEIHDKESGLLKKFNFSYNYFESEPGGGVGPTNEGCLPLCPSRNEFYLRLKLQSIQEEGNSGANSRVPPYRFQYHEGVALPNRFSTAIDFWGYYSGQIANDRNSTPTLLPNYSNPNLDIHFGGGVDRSPSLEYTKAYSLKRIIYPLGGSSTFEYELNTAQLDPDKIIYNTNISPVSVAVKGFTPGITQEPLYKETTFTLPSSRQVRFSLKSENFRLTEVKAPRWYVYSDDPGLHIDSIHNATEYYRFRVDETVIDEYNFTFRKTLPAGRYKLRANMKYWNDPLLEPAFVYLASWDEHNSTTESIPPVKYAGGLRVKKVIESDGTRFNKNIVSSYNYDFFYQPGSSSGLLTSDPLFVFQKEQSCSARCQVVFLTSSSNFPLSTIQSGNVAYRNVEVVYEKINDNGEIINNGKTRYWFNVHPEEYWSGGGKYPFAPSIRYDWRNGLINKKQDFDSAGNLVREEHHRYNFGVNINRSLGVRVAGSFESACYSRYFAHSEWFYKDSTSVMNIQEDQDSIILQSSFKHDSPHHTFLTSTETLQSNGDVLVTDYAYPEDKSVSFMTSKHVLSPVLEQRTTRNGSFISGSKSHYGINPNDHLVLEETQIAHKENEYETVNRYLRYDIDGKPEEVEGRAGVKQAIIWTPLEENPLAIVSNAQRNQIYYNSFEYSEGVEVLHAKTGKKAFFGNYTVSSLPAGNYTKEWSVYDGTDWVEHKQSFTHSGGGISFSNPGQYIDEIRIYPEGSQMQSYTYEYSQVSSVTDANGTTAYYEYDSHRRLKAVKDLEGNVLSVHDYQYYNPN